MKGRPDLFRTVTSFSQQTFCSRLPRSLFAAYRSCCLYNPRFFSTVNEYHGTSPIATGFGSIERRPCILGDTNAATQPPFTERTAARGETNSPFAFCWVSPEAFKAWDGDGDHMLSHFEFEKALCRRVLHFMFLHQPVGRSALLRQVPPVVGFGSWTPAPG